MTSPPAMICQWQPNMHALILYALLKDTHCTYQHGYVHRLQAWEASVLLASRRLLFLKAWEPSTLMLRIT